MTPECLERYANTKASSSLYTNFPQFEVPNCSAVVPLTCSSEQNGNRSPEFYLRLASQVRLVFLEPKEKKVLKAFLAQTVCLDLLDGLESRVMMVLTVDQVSGLPSSRTRENNKGGKKGLTNDNFVIIQTLSIQIHCDSSVFYETQ